MDEGWQTTTDGEGWYRTHVDDDSQVWFVTPGPTGGHLELVSVPDALVLMTVPAANIDTAKAIASSIEAERRAE